MWYLLPIFLLGVLTPIQTAANSRLRQSVVSPFIASFVSFSVGTVFLLIVTLVEKGSVLIDYELISTLPWWAWLGGICGLWGLTVNIIIFPKLGAMQTALMPMSGQIIMGLIIDSFGLLRSQQFPFTLSRVLSVLVILLGMFMVVYRKTSGSKGDRKLIWQVIGFSGGAVFALQPSMNSLLSVGLYSSVHSAFISFFSATIVLFLIAVFITSNRVHIRQIFSFDRPWWSWLGGIIGATFVTGFAFFATKTGIGILLVTSICGLLANSLAIDKFGWFGTTKRDIRAVQYLGLLCVVLGIMALRLNE